MKKRCYPTHLMRPVLSKYQNQKMVAQKIKLLTTIIINIDAKIINTIAANRIKCLKKMIIHYDQVGAIRIPEMKGCFDIQKSTNVIYHIDTIKQKNDVII